MAIEGCPSWGDFDFPHGKEKYGNIKMATKEESPPGISGVAVMPLGLTKRFITVTGVMVESADLMAGDFASMQEAYEAACETFTLDKFTTGNGRIFESVRFIDIDWDEPFTDANGLQGAKYVATLEQLLPPKAPG